MWRAATVLFLASLAFAQDTQPDDIATASKSPALLERYIQTHAALDWGALRRALGTREPDNYYPCGKRADDPCLTQLITVRNPEQQILILRRKLAQGHIVYLRYVHSANGDWRLSGERGAWENNGCSCGHAVSRLSGRPLLKITSDRTQNGGYLAQEVEDWFDLTQPGFEPVFSYSTYFSWQPSSQAVSRTAKAQVVPRVVQGLESIDLILKTHFEGPGFDMPATYVGVYERPVSEKSFRLRRAYSGLDRRVDIPIDDFKAMVGVDAFLSNERLVYYAFPQLKKVASGTDEEAKEWLRLILSQAGDTPEKRALTDLLGKP